MELKVIKKDEKKLLLEIKEESETLTNLLREELWAGKGVKEAAHIKEHPYLTEPKIFVRTGRGSPVSALQKATKRAMARVREFKEEVKKAL